MRDELNDIIIPTPDEGMEFAIGRSFFATLEGFPQRLRLLLRLDSTPAEAFPTIQQLAARALLAYAKTDAHEGFGGCVWLSPTLKEGLAYQRELRLWFQLPEDGDYLAGKSAARAQLICHSLAMHQVGRTRIDPWAIPSLAAQDGEVWQLWSLDRTGPVRMFLEADPKLSSLTVLGFEPGADGAGSTLPGLGHGLALRPDGRPYNPQEPCRHLQEDETGRGPRRVVAPMETATGGRFEVLLVDAQVAGEVGRNVHTLAAFDDLDEAESYAATAAAEPMNGAPQEGDSIAIYDHQEERLAFERERPITGDWQ
jgi:hypothetical protein